MAQKRRQRNVVQKNGLGWLRDLPDARDHYYEPPKMLDIPSSVDLRSNFPKVYAQGNVGSCTAQALAAVLQFDEAKQKQSQDTAPSRLFVYYNERLLMNTTESDSGASMRIGIKSLSEYGYCREDIWPYDLNKWRSKPNRTAYRLALAHKIKEYARVGQDINQLKTTLAAGNPFVFGFTAYQSFESDEVKKNGILPMPHNEKVVGGHAVVAVGYDDADQTFLIRNSWGEDWGIEGYFKIPYAYLTDPNLAADFWIISQIP
jgi:C1A family cysteine protease